MKLKRIARLKLGATDFKLGGELFEITDTPGKKRTVWMLHKRFKGQVRYRVLADTRTKVPVAVQRLKAS